MKLDKKQLIEDWQEYRRLRRYFQQEAYCVGSFDYGKGVSGQWMSLDEAGELASGANPLDLDVHIDVYPDEDEINKIMWGKTSRKELIKEAKR